MSRRVPRVAMGQERKPSKAAEDYGFVRVKSTVGQKLASYIASLEYEDSRRVGDPNAAEPFHSIVTRHDGEGKSLIVCGFPNRRQL